MTWFGISTMLSEAGISADKLFRWWLYRCWAADLPLIIWVMMNPSTADHTKNDATISKVIRYCKLWGYGGVLVLNVYAFRSRDQGKILGQVGSRNDWWISFALRFAKRHKIKVICAWGRNHKTRGDEVRRLAKQTGKKLLCLELAANGEPKHPLWLRGDLTPRRL